MNRKKRGHKLLLTLVCMMVMFCICGIAASAATTVTVNFDVTRNCVMAYEAFQKINEQRTAGGLDALQWNDYLMYDAMERADEIAFVFDHVRPTNESYTTVIGSDVTYTRSAENIAYGYASASAVVNGWMNSSGHKANIMSSAYTQTAIGCSYINGTYYWVQIFADGTPSRSTVPTSVKTSVSYMIIDCMNLYIGLAKPDNIPNSWTTPYVTMDRPVELVPVHYNPSDNCDRYVILHANSFDWYTSTDKTLVSDGVEIVDDSGTTGFIKGRKEGTAEVVLNIKSYYSCADVNFYHSHYSTGSATCLKERTCDGCGTVLQGKTSCSAKASATCTAASVCKYCNKTLSPALGHQYSTSGTLHQEATVYAPAVYKYKCTRCDAYQLKEKGNKEEPWALARFYWVTLQKKQTFSEMQISMGKGDRLQSVKSSKPNVAKVKSFTADGFAVIKAGKKKGDAILTFQTAAGAEATVKITVQSKAIKTTKISNVPAKLTIKKGKTKTLKPVIQPLNSSQKITFKSSNKKIVTVTAKGKIKAKKKGTATITVKSGSRTVKCKVKVK